MVIKLLLDITFEIDYILYYILYNIRAQKQWVSSISIKQ